MTDGRYLAARSKASLDALSSHQELSLLYEIGGGLCSASCALLVGGAAIVDELRLLVRVVVGATRSPLVIAALWDRTG